MSGLEDFFKYIMGEDSRARAGRRTLDLSGKEKLREFYGMLFANERPRIVSAAPFP
ncbi:MAG: hypothetical protein M1455_09930 [Actinobacteria bacterium]|nr:hypothetical protein [Actinomycetota bacterium]MCL5736725.1 hypothetical protein [Actinomycetota bacterium]